MTEDSYPHSPTDVVGTLVDLYKHQDDRIMSSLLESATASIDFEEYDNWNGGQYYYSLQLKVPRKQFANLEPRIESLQNSLGTKLGTVFKDADPYFLTSVVITPFIKHTIGALQNIGAQDAIERIWGADGFRLFLSHVSQHKKHITDLKKTLSIYGVRAFVAHEDIQPTQDWQAEIETALNTMHGMAAIITPEFKDSLWTDQEVGYALGRGIKVITVKVSEFLPYGLIARQQAFTADFSDMLLMAKGIISILVKDSSTHPRMRDSLAEAIVHSSCSTDTNLIVDQLEKIGTITAENAELITIALKENSQVSEAFGVLKKLEALLEPYEMEVAITEDENDLPF